MVHGILPRGSKLSLPVQVQQLAELSRVVLSYYMSNNTIVVRAHYVPEDLQRRSILIHGYKNLYSR
jgi:hypothetical protein